MKRALIVVGVQKDYFKEGIAVIKGAEKALKPINEVIDLFHKNKDLVVFVRNWVPNVSSFGYRHHQKTPCIANSSGAKFHEKLRFSIMGNLLFNRRSTDEKDSALEADDGYYALSNFLVQEDITDVFLVGVPGSTVAQTAEDSLKYNLNPTIVIDAVALNKLDLKDVHADILVIKLGQAKKLLNRN